jgi:hypothetical protein
MTIFGAVSGVVLGLGSEPSGVSLSNRHRTGAAGADGI